MPGGTSSSGISSCVEPGTTDFFANSGVNSLTGASLQEPRLRVTAEQNPSARFIAMTDDEYRQAAIKKRGELGATWPKVNPMAVPSSNSYATGVFFKRAGRTIARGCRRPPCATRSL